MTYSIKTILSCLFISFSVLTVAANPAASFTVSALGNSSFILKLDAAQQPEIQVTIKDQSGFILLEETIFQTSISNRVYDLQQLPSNSYALVVSYDDVIKVQPIEKEGHQLIIDPMDAQTILKPVFQATPGFMTVEFSPLANATNRLYILDPEGRVIHQENSEAEAGLHKRYNLLQLETGNYSFVLEVKSAAATFNFKEPISIDAALVASN